MKTIGLDVRLGHIDVKYTLICEWVIKCANTTLVICE